MMPTDPLIQSEEDLVWSANDVEKSLLHNEINSVQKKNNISRWSQLMLSSFYLVLSFCFGALVSLAIPLLSQSRSECGFLSQNNQWSTTLYDRRMRLCYAETICLVQTSELREVISDSYTNVRFNGTFSRSSPYKGPPSPEVDALWNQVTGCVMSISEEIYEHLNASKHAVKVPKNLGGGRMAIFETIHQIHCVQALWHAAYPEYYAEQQEFKLSHPDEWYEHIDHCADMLRQKLMCDVDMNIITYNWVKGHSNPHPNFNVQHQCRNFEAVLKFARDHQIDKDNKDRIDVNLLKPTNGPIMEFEGEPPFDPDAIPLQSQ